jgi:hypothetical protein
MLFDLPIIGDPDDGMIVIDTGLINGYGDIVTAVINLQFAVNQLSPDKVGDGS